MNQIKDDFGKTIDDSIAGSIDELDDLGVSLQELIDAGRLGFRLGGDALVDYLRRSLHAMIAAGGRLTTVTGDPDDDPWLFTTRYGTTPDEIVENVIAAGLPREGHLEWGSFRFASPKPPRSTARNCDGRVGCRGGERQHAISPHDLLRRRSH